VAVIITNIHGLPGPVVRAVTPRSSPDERREGAFISVTELLGPPRIKQLREIFWDEMEIDASELIYMALGTAIHDILERNSGWELSERRLRMEVLGNTVSGKFDLVTDASGMKLVDYKSTSVWAYIMGGRQEWEEQLNIYRLLMVDNEMDPPASMSNVLFFRDWKAADVTNTEGYPSAPIVELPQKVWPIERTRKFVEDRMRLHLQTMPECDDLERWRKGDLWSIQKPEAKRAFRVMDSEFAAKALLQQLHSEGKTDMVVVHRPGTDKRCAEFCPVRTFCDHGRAVLGLPPIGDEPQ